MMEFDVKNEETETKGTYYIEVEGKRVSEMTYSIAGAERIIIDHTHVEDDYRGKGLGDQMVKQAVEDARAKQISILPLCPFARSVFNKNESLRDVL